MRIMAFERYRKRIGEEEAKRQDEFMKKLCEAVGRCMRDDNIDEIVPTSSTTALDTLRYIEEHMGQPGFYFDLGMPFDEYKRKVEEIYGITEHGKK